VGGNDAQLSLIENQLKLTLDSLSFDKVLAQELRRLSDIYKALSRKAMPYEVQFWDVYSKNTTQCIASFKSEANTRGIQLAMSQLIAYAQFVEENNKNSNTERKKIVDEMLSLVGLQLQVMLAHAKEPNGWSNECSSLYRELYEWDVTHKCWVDLTTCGLGCTEGFECRSSDHLVWSNHKGAPGLWGQRQSSGGGCEWYNTKTGQTFPIGKFHDIFKPPPTVLGTPAPPSAPAPAPFRFGTGYAVPDAKIKFGSTLTWAKLTPKDFCAISESILLLSYSRMFCTYFGREKVLLERIVSKYNDLVNYLDDTYKHLGKGCQANLKGESSQDTLLLRRAHTLLVKALQGSHNDKGEFVPKYPDQYKVVVHVEMPRRLSDPTHWGHLAWQFCEFMDAHPSYGDLVRSA
jgi:hypothetical protein